MKALKKKKIPTTRNNTSNCRNILILPDFAPSFPPFNIQKHSGLTLRMPMKRERKRNTKKSRKWRWKHVARRRKCWYCQNQDHLFFHFSCLFSPFIELIFGPRQRVDDAVQRGHLGDTLDPRKTLKKGGKVWVKHIVCTNFHPPCCACLPPRTIFGKTATDSCFVSHPVRREFGCIFGCIFGLLMNLSLSGDRG